MRLLCIILISLTSAKATSWEKSIQPPLKSDWRGRDLDNRIGGGLTASEGQFPSNVYIEVDSGDVFCGGVILNEKWVMTAANCIYKNFYQRVDVYMGCQNYPCNFDAHHTVHTAIGWGLGFFPHENYTYEASTPEYDIGLIDMGNSPISFNQYIQPAKLASSDAGLSSVTTVGWGTNTGPAYISPDLLYDNNPVSPDCTGDFLCVKPGSGNGACFYDFGTAMFAQGTDELHGLATDYVTCGDAGRNGGNDIYTRITSHLAWIESKTGIKP